MYVYIQSIIVIISIIIVMNCQHCHYQSLLLYHGIYVCVIVYV